MFTPNIQTYNELQETIERQHQEGLNLNYPHFDFYFGWGHNFIEGGDEWEAVVRNGKKWRFHAAISDQGLWYYFVKYYKMDGSIVIGNRLQTVSPGDDGQPSLKNQHHIIEKYDPRPVVDPNNCESGGGEVNFWCYPGYRGFVHFMGDSKPWLKNPNERHGKHHRPGEALKLWHTVLSEINDDCEMGLDLEHYNTKILPTLDHPPLGYLAQWSDHARLVQGKQSVSEKTTPT